MKCGGRGGTPALYGLRWICRTMWKNCRKAHKQSQGTDGQKKSTGWTKWTDDGRVRQRKVGVVFERGNCEAGR